jgi:hypothetical protein
LAAAAAAATDGGLSFVLKKWYRSAGYWGGPARTSADRRTFAAVAAGGRPRTSGFADDFDHVLDENKNFVKSEAHFHMNRMKNVFFKLIK